MEQWIIDSIGFRIFWIRHGLDPLLTISTEFDQFVSPKAANTVSRDLSSQWRSSLSVDSLSTSFDPVPPGPRPCRPLLLVLGRRRATITTDLIDAYSAMCGEVNITQEWLDKLPPASSDERLRTHHGFQ